MPTPVWDRVLRDMCPEHEFLMRVLGYGLMADLSEEMIFILYGDGQNGKSKILECVKNLMGDYSTTYSSKALVKNRFDDSKEDAKLRGKRFALCEEIPLGARWDDDKIKNATSSGTLTVKLMRENAFEMPSRYRVFLATNYLPALDGLDFAMRRRLCLIHFPRTVAENEKDKKLSVKLEAEAPGILAKLIRAAQAWFTEGLVLPESVKAAVSEYMDDNDEIQAWLDSECTKDDAAVSVTHDLYRSYACYVEATTRAPMSPQGFGMALKKKGFAKGKETSGKKRRVIHGLKLNPS
jgi:putative DNA primase/helicase